jgi:ribosome maturation factor RimP
VGKNPLFLICVSEDDLDQGGVLRHAWGLLEGPLLAAEFELVEVEYSHQGRGALVRLFVDKDGGVTLDDCAAASRLAEPLLEEADFIAGNCSLEVSSPGIARPLRKAADFSRFEGERIKVKTIAPIAGRRRFTGRLEGLNEDRIVVDCDGTVCEIHLENLLKAHLDR